MSCKFFLVGKCKKGAECDRVHISKAEVCNKAECVEKFNGHPNHTREACFVENGKCVFSEAKKAEEIAKKEAKKAAMTPEELATYEAVKAKAKAVQEAEEAKKAAMTPEELAIYMAEKKAKKSAAKAAGGGGQTMNIELSSAWGDMMEPSTVLPRTVHNAKPTYAEKAIPGLTAEKNKADKALFIADVQKRAKIAEKKAMLEHICSGVGRLIANLKPVIDETISELFKGFDSSMLTIEMVVDEVKKSPETNEVIKAAMSSEESYQGFVLDKLHDAVKKAAPSV